jgi:hypothetical protein
MRLSVERSQWISQTWTESYNNLFERTILQSRNHLALALTHSLIDGTAVLNNALARYAESYRVESRQDFGGFGAAAVEAFNELSVTDAVRYERPALPANLLRLATSWCLPNTLREVSRTYLRAVAAFGESASPIERVAPIVAGGFRIYAKRFTEEDRATFLAAMVGFLRHQRLEPSNESSKFIMNLLLRVRQTAPPSSELYTLTHSAVTSLHLRGHVQRTEDAICAIVRSYSLQSPTFDVERWLRPDWAESPPLVAAYLELLRQALEPSEANGEICDNILATLSQLPHVQEKSARLFLKHGRIAQAAECVTKLAEASPEYHNIDGLWALVAATSGDVERAYGFMARTIEGDKDRLDPWLSVRLHQECASHATGQTRQIHYICAALSETARLVSPTVLSTSAASGLLDTFSKT